MLIAQASLRKVVEEAVIVSQPNTGSNIKVANVQIFNGETGVS